MSGLREQKKARTRMAIQRQALLLFRDRGFESTTMEQIAAAAEVAPSTVFRYFPTKESLAELADYHSFADRFGQVFQAQPAELSSLAALRATLRELFAHLTPDEAAARRERDVLIVTIPQVWSANVDLLREGARVVAQQVAARSGRDEHDIEVVTFTGAVIGAAVGALSLWARQPEADPGDLIDAALGRLEAGLRW
ncbi:TetR family transcriptional regulator [Stackebrandtia endophytica]|uniref:acyl-CoA-like ligand-binding transcription factor n=1 Tax=Stackebrandtia endophytica TaxID=1496996 RepID=UPI00114ECDDF|nr:TetR family transcriptional regulator [Stackebrandtia endophytica]